MEDIFAAPLRPQEIQEMMIAEVEFVREWTARLSEIELRDLLEVFGLTTEGPLAQLRVRLAAHFQGLPIPVRSTQSRSG